MSSVLAKVRNSLDQTGNRLTKFGARLKDVGQRTFGLSASVAASIGGAAFAFQRFEQSMNRVGAVSGATGDQLAQMSAQAKQLGSTTAFSAKEAAEGMGFLAQAGFKTNEIMSAMPGVLQLAAAGQADLATASDIASNVLSGYGIAASEINRVNNILVKTFTSSNTSLESLGESFKYVAPIARASGLAIEEVSAAIGIMGDAGVQGSQAGTALQGGIAKLLKPSKEAKQILADLGVQVTDSTGRMRPLQEIMQGLAPITNDAAKMIELFGTEAVKGMAALVANATGRFTELKTEIENVGDIAAEVEKKQLAGFTGAWTNFQSAADGVSVAIGEALAPTLALLLQALTDLANWITKHRRPRVPGIAGAGQDDDRRRRYPRRRAVSARDGSRCNRQRRAVRRGRARQGRAGRQGRQHRPDDPAARTRRRHRCARRGHRAVGRRAEQDPEPARPVEGPASQRVGEDRRPRSQL